MALVVHAIIPWLSGAFGLPSVVAWYVSGTAVLLVPMLVYAVVMARRETALPDWQAVASRLRLARVNGGDVAWALGGVVAVLALTAVIFAAAHAVDTAFLPVPSFLR